MILVLRADASLVYRMLASTRPSPRHSISRVNQEPYAPQSVAQIPITQSPGTAVGSFDLVSNAKVCA